MESNFPFSILLTCCLCLLCLVVLAVVGAAIYFVMKKRDPEGTAPLSPGAPEVPVTGKTTVVEGKVSEPANESFIPKSSSPAPSKPAETYATETLISSPMAEPVVEPVVEPVPDEKPGNPFKPGSIAASSWDVDFDVRELYMLGFTEAEMHEFTREEIQAVLDSKISLNELRQRHQAS